MRTPQTNATPSKTACGSELHNSITRTSKQITSEQWNRTHPDFKTIINGQCFVLAMVEGKGTCLVPVQIIQA